METSSSESISIMDKDESSEKSYHVVEGFVIEDSKSPFPQNGHLSFVPEDYGKEKAPAAKRTRNHNNSATPTGQHSNGGSAKGSPEDGDEEDDGEEEEEEEELQPGQLKCEFCHIIGDRESFLPPSRRFCSITCCKRYSAEKRYYPYGRDPQGIAKSIREGLLNPRSRHLRGGKTSSKAQKVRDQRRRKLAYYNSGGNADQGASSDTTATPKTPRTKRGRRQARKPNQTTSPTQTVKREREGHLNTSIIVEPYTHPTGAPLHTWTVDDVGEFLTHLGYEAYLDRFVEHEIDGKALSLVKDHHLLMTLKLRLGPTLKIIENVNAVKILEEDAED